MTVRIVKFLFFLYQAVSSPNRTCRFIPTCSDYALQAIEKYGLLQGSAKAIARVTSCHPFTKRPIYDPA